MIGVGFGTAVVGAAVVVVAVGFVTAVAYVVVIGLTVVADATAPVALPALLAFATCFVLGCTTALFNSDGGKKCCEIPAGVARTVVGLSVLYSCCCCFICLWSA